MIALQIVPVHMGVNLRRRNVGVTEKGLNRAKIRTSFKQMGCETVAQGVHLRLHPCLLADFLETLPHALAGKAPAKVIEEYKAAASLGIVEPRPTLGKIPGHPVLRFFPQRDHALLIPLSGDTDQGLTEMDPLGSQSHRLGNPQTAGINQFEQTAIPKAQFGGIIDLLQDKLHFFHRKHPGKPLGQLGISRPAAGL
jgi:hypothetical protein